MSTKANLYILKPLLNKWNLSLIIFCLLPALAFASSNNSDFNKINQLHSQHLQTQVLEVIKKVDEAIYSVIKLPDRERLRFATLITLSCQKYKIDPRIMISIIKVESDFKQKAVSNTGDYSVAQINFKIWAKNFRKLDRQPLHFERLKEDDAYAIFRMGEILSELQKDYSKTDKFWFARYHSNTPKFKNAYIKKLQFNLKKLLPYGPNLLETLPAYETIIAVK